MECETYINHRLEKNEKLRKEKREKEKIKKEKDEKESKREKKRVGNCLEAEIIVNTV